MKTILFVSGSLEMLPGIDKAHELGIRVVVSDQNPDAPGMKASDFSIVADTYDPQVTLSGVQKFQKEHGKIHGALCLGADVPTTVAVITNKLGLHGISLESARLASDKLAMKRAFKKSGVATPWFSSVESEQHLEDIFLKRRLPLVVKPVDSRGARGVTILRHADQARDVYNEAVGHSPTSRVMVEEFLDGPQVSTESIIIDGQSYTPGVSDRNYEFLDKFAPYIIENGGELPSKLTDGTQQAILSLVAKGGKSLGIGSGVVKGDIVVHKGEPYIIELAARLSGGYFCTHEIPLNTGVDFVGLAIKQAIGESVSADELKPLFSKPVVQRYLFPKPGIVEYVTGIESVLQMEDIVMAEVRVFTGDKIGPIHNHPARAGVVIATGVSVKAAQTVAEKAIATIHVETK